MVKLIPHFLESKLKKINFVQNFAAFMNDMSDSWKSKKRTYVEYPKSQDKTLQINLQNHFKYKIIQVIIMPSSVNVALKNNFIISLA